MACAACRSESDFRRIVSTQVIKLLKHRGLVAALGQIDLDHLVVHKLIGINIPDEHLARAAMQTPMRERPVLALWLARKEPMVLELPRDAGLMSKREIDEIVAHGLGRLAIHGVLDLHARTGSYFSFTEVVIEQDEASVLERLRLVVPLLHAALMNLQHEGGPPDRPTSLSTAERDLLKWVAAGRSNLEIARLRGTKEATVRNQLHRLYAKLGVANRAEATRVAMTML